MSFSWKENATLVRTAAAGQMDDQSSTALFEGLLSALALKVRTMKPIQRCGMRLPLPNRQVRPHTFRDGAL
jgi:hypothetical protein